MPHLTARRSRLPNDPASLFLLSTAMAAIAATGIATAFHAAFDDERSRTVACECSCGEAALTPAPEAVAVAPAPEAEPMKAPADEEPLEATVDGELDRDLIRRIVRAHIDEVRYCYNEGLARDPELGGTVVVDFTIDAQGNVADSTSNSTMHDREVPECIAQAVERWLFPKPRRGTVKVTYPFQLAPG